MLTKRRTAWLPVCVALMLASRPPALEAAAFSTGGVSAAPVHWDPSNAATRTYFIPSIAPGGAYRDEVRVVNPNNDSVDLVINAVDGVTAPPSGAVYANRADPVVEAGAWLTPDLTQLTLGAGQSSLVGFTVRVPADAVPGDHLAGLALENTHPVAGNGQISISSVVRTVVGVLIKVPGPAGFDMAVGAALIQPLIAQGVASVVVPVTDTGLLLGRPTLTITLSGPNGYRRTLSRNLDTILPGDTIDYPFPWPDSLAAGAYTIEVSAIGPGMTRPATSRSRATLGTRLKGVAVEAAASASPASIASRTPAWLVPLMVGGAAVLAALLAAVFFLVALLRRQRRDMEPSTSSEVRGRSRATGG